MRTGRFILEIFKSTSGYEGRFHQGDPEQCCHLSNLLLGDDSEVLIKEQSYTLRYLINEMIAYHPETIASLFDECGQRQLGQYLYSQTIGTLSTLEKERLKRLKIVDLRIIAEDENIGRLPWTLLADSGVFLSAAGWSITLSSHIKYQDHTMPPAPVMLLVLPQPKGKNPTEAEAHRKVLEEDFRGHKLYIAETWEEFKRLSTECAPQVIYYYGHGEGDWNNSRLLFPDEKTKTPKEIPIADVANLLRKLPNTPRLVYLNCCYGDTGGILGAGRQLGSFIPAVVTNSTAADIDAAREQGLYFLRSVLLKGVPPHKAIADMRGDLSDLDLTFKDLRWMTPVLHCHYDNWTANLSRPRNRLERDPHWYLKVNRGPQFSIVHSNTVRMMTNSAPPALAYVWYGEEDQGVNIFNQRLDVELQAYASSQSLRFRRIDLDWPMHFADPASDFEYMFTSALRDRTITSVDDIPRCIAGEFKMNGDQPILLYISNTQPLRPSIVQPRELKRFLQWWESRFVAALDNTQMFAVLGLSFILKNAEEDRLLLKKREMSNWSFNSILFKVLDELESLAVPDLREYLILNQINLPPDRLTRTLENILSRSNGRYEPTLPLLRDIEQDAWKYDLDD